MKEMSRKQFIKATEKLGFRWDGMFVNIGNGIGSGAVISRKGICWRNTLARAIKERQKKDDEIAKQEEMYSCTRCHKAEGSYGDEGSALCQTCYSVVADLQYERSKDNQSTF
jgi:ribosomal protein L37AE/L43A